MELIIYILLVYGITNIIVQGSIFDGLKEWLTEKAIIMNNKPIKFLIEKLLTLSNCHMCTGFHVGWFIGIFFGPFVFWNIIFNGAFYSGTCWIINALVQYLGNGDPIRTVSIMTEEPISIEHINKEDDD